MTSYQTKPYSEMTEEEAKEWFKYCFKRTATFENISESYVCNISDIKDYRSGYGVIRNTPNPDDPSEKYDANCMYDIEELKQYMEDYPEMVVEGWISPLTEEQELLKTIRTEWVYYSDDQLKSELFSSQLTTFISDDIWEGPVSEEDIGNNPISTLSTETGNGNGGSSVYSTTGGELASRAGYLINWKGGRYTCDEASVLISQYQGDEDEKAEEVKAIRNLGKNYIRQLVNKFLEEHGDSPEEPSFTTVYTQE